MCKCWETEAQTRGGGVWYGTGYDLMLRVIT